MPNSKWSDDDFLNDLRRQVDTQADECLRELVAHGNESDFRNVFRQMTTNDEPLPEGLPKALRGFFEQTSGLPTLDGAPLDEARLARGSAVFLKHAFPSALVLLAKSLPEGYSAPNLSLILSLSDNLNRNPYRRLMGVLQLLVNLCAKTGFEKNGKGLVTAQKLRLLHAGVRQLAPKHLPDYAATYQQPCNQEDMLGTIMGFSLLVIEGLRILGVPLAAEDAEDYYYVWRIFAVLMGIHPPGRPDSSEIVPADLTQARLFYDSFVRRHYRQAPENPKGAELAGSLLRMMDRMLPRTPLRMLGLRIVPRIYMEQLTGRGGMIRVGLRPVPLLFLTKWLLRMLPRIWMWFWKEGDKLDPTGSVHENLSRIFFQGLITRTAGGEVTFMVPRDMQDLRELA